MRFWSGCFEGKLVGGGLSNNSLSAAWVLDLRFLILRVTPDSTPTRAVESEASLLTSVPNRGACPRRMVSLWRRIIRDER
jgi:hypothetical protein